MMKSRSFTSKVQMTVAGMTAIAAADGGTITIGMIADIRASGIITTTDMVIRIVASDTIRTIGTPGIMVGTKTVDTIAMIGGEIKITGGMKVAIGSVTTIIIDIHIVRPIVHQDIDKIESSIEVVATMNVHQDIPTGIIGVTEATGWVESPDKKGHLALLMPATEAGAHIDIRGQNETFRAVQGWNRVGAGIGAWTGQVGTVMTGPEVRIVVTVLIVVATAQNEVIGPTGVTVRIDHGQDKDMARTRISGAIRFAPFFCLDPFTTEYYM